MDTLTFSTPVLLRHLTFSEAKKMPISEIHLNIALEDLGMNMDQVRYSSIKHRLQYKEV
jgi:flap endonuclease-1